MSVLNLLQTIREEWIQRVSKRIARGAGVRASFLEQARRFYKALYQSLESGDPAWIEHVIDNWAEAQTESELAGESASLSKILSELMLETQACSAEALPPADANRLLGSLLPLYGDAYEYATKRDINLRVEHIMRELEQARNQLEQLDKSKSDFISVAAHELKTPLTLIEGYTAMIRELLPQESETSYSTTLLHGIDNGTRRLREIIDDMIDVSLLDNNLLSLNFQPLWINRIIHTLEMELLDPLAERQLRFKVVNFPGFDVMTFGDPERLYQAFRNLMINAIKYTPDGGSIRVDGRSLPGFLEITITDTGIGIDPANHTLIFEKFGQIGQVSLHSSGKTKFKGGGPGLGLPITRGLIEAHGGTIWVESEKQDEVSCPGSIFHVMLPVLKDPPDERSMALFQSLIEGIHAK